MACPRTLTCVLLLAGLLACAGGPAPQDHFYRFQVPPPAQTRSQPVLDGVLEIERPLADDLLRERAILRSERANATEVKPYAYHRWVDSPTLLLQRELARWLQEYGLARQTVLPEAGVNERWLVTGRLERFEHVESTGSVLVELDLRVRDLKRGNFMQRRYAAKAPAADVTASPTAFGAALGAIFEQFAGDVASGM